MRNAPLGLKPVVAVVLSVGLLVLGAGGAAAAPSSKPFAIEPGSFHVVPSTDQAGAHPNLVIEFNFDHQSGPEEKTFNDVRTAVVNFPPGLLGSSTAVPKCTDAQLASTGTTSGEPCPPDTQIGTIGIDLNVSSLRPVRYTAGLYFMQTNTGVAATIGFSVGGITQIIPISVRPGDSGLTATAPSIPGVTEPHAVVFTIWGVPASPVHNAQRGQVVLERYPGAPPEYQGGGEEVQIPVRPLLSNPTSCAGPSRATISSNSWEEPEKWSEAETEFPAMTGCERLPFFPSLEVQPTTRSAESPSGLDISLVVPQTYEDPESLATSHLERSVIALPVGYTINPSAGNGLGSCTPAQFEAETAQSLPGEGCPAESKLGAVEVETPLIEEKLGGSIYIATPYDNKPEFGSPAHPGGSLLALYIIVKDPERGIIVKLPAKIEPNPVTGQIVTISNDDPQVPFSRFTLKLRQGATSPLVSPPACGTYTANALFTPWSEPLAELPLSNSFEVEDGIGGGACPAGGVPPFDPGVVAGTLNNSAGSYSPLDLRITRNDGEQEITRFSNVFPPGITGDLAGIPLCPQADIEAARSETGAEELEHPSCPAASEIGHTLVSAGVGPVLAQAPGKIYLAGTYHGAGLSVVSITAAKVGPFDLGTVVIQFTLRINPTTAQVEVNGATSDAIPHIIDGIVVHVREIHAYIDRERFIINPTNCDPLTVLDTITGAGANYAVPSDQVPVTVSTPFQAADCSDLEFKPVFKAQTSAHTSRVDGASLHVTLALPEEGGPGKEANVARVKVSLPKQLPSPLKTLQKACTEKVFEENPGGCPVASEVGSVRVSTPILASPLTGPAYFVSHGGAKYPELIMVLSGENGIQVQVHGETFISKQGITSATFSTVPDVPFSSFELTLPEREDPALTANGNLCKGGLLMPTEMVGQNGMALKQSTRITVTGCPKQKKATHHKKQAKKAKRKR